MSTKTKPSMSDSHKQALAEGRQQSAVVRRYLELLSSTRRGPGRRRSETGIKTRLSAIEIDLLHTTLFEELLLRQERSNLTAELAALNGEDLSAVEQAFIEVAADFAERRGIAYATWRDVGVPAAVLKRAGIIR